MTDLNKTKLSDMKKVSSLFAEDVKKIWERDRKEAVIKLSKITDTNFTYVYSHTSTCNNEVEKIYYIGRLLEEANMFLVSIKIVENYMKGIRRICFYRTEQLFSEDDYYIMFEYNSLLSSAKTAKQEGRKQSPSYYIPIYQSESDSIVYQEKYIQPFPDVSLLFLDSEQTKIFNKKAIRSLLESMNVSESKLKTKNEKDFYNSLFNRLHPKDWDPMILYRVINKLSDALVINDINFRKRANQYAWEVSKRKKILGKVKTVLYETVTSPYWITGMILELVGIFAEGYAYRAKERRARRALGRY